MRKEECIFLLERWIVHRPDPNPPDEWVTDVLSRSRFDFTIKRKTEKIWYTEDIDFSHVNDGVSSSNGYVKLSFKKGQVVAIGFDSIER